MKETLVWPLTILTLIEFPHCKGTLLTFTKFVLYFLIYAKKNLNTYLIFLMPIDLGEYLIPQC